MNDTAFIGATITRLRAAGHTVVDGEDKVTLSVTELAALLSQHTLDVVPQFVRLQRGAGIQTVRYSTGSPDSFTYLVERMADFDLLLDKDKDEAKQQLQQRIVDIRPVVDGRLFSLCNQHRTLADLGLCAEQGD